MKQLTLMIIILLLAVTSCSESEKKVIIPKDTSLLKPEFYNNKCNNWEVESGVYNTVSAVTIGVIVETIHCFRANQNHLDQAVLRMSLVKTEDGTLYWVDDDDLLHVE